MEYKNPKKGLFEPLENPKSQDEINKRLQDLSEYATHITEGLDYITEIWNSDKATDEEIREEVRKIRRYITTGLTE